MSVEQTNRTWKMSPYSDTTLVIHLVLADRADEEGRGISLAQASIADRARCSVSTVKRHIKTMIEDGYIEVEKQGGAALGSTNHYRLLWPGWVDTQKRHEVKNGYSQDARGHSCDLGQVDTHRRHEVTVDLQDSFLSNSNSNTNGSAANSENPKPMSSADLLARSQTKRSPERQARVEKTAKPKPQPTPNTVLAQKLVRDKWDHEKESTGKNPLWSFPGVLGIVSTYLNGGHSEEDVLYLLDNSPVYTKAAFQLTLSQRDKPAAGRAATKEAMSALDNWAQEKNQQTSSHSLEFTEERANIVDITDDQRTRGFLNE